MAGRRKELQLNQFPHGESCDECGSKRWYAESGFRYCKRGHRIEGFVEQAIDEDDNFGQQGRIARKKRDVKERVTRHLVGNEARELYLECLQLILRRQLWWLVHTRGLPAELETVVRDLWDLRVRNFDGLKQVIAGPAEASESELDGEELLFSSHEATSDSDASTQSKASRARSWTSKPGQSWNMPGLFHCLALCYLGCVSLNLPVRVGQIYEWAKKNQLPFLEAFYALPGDMTTRLPGAYHRALIIRHMSFQGGELHRSVLEMVVDYHVNYALAFPALNAPLLLFHYLRELALPAEVYVHVRAMGRLLHLDFSFKLQKKKIRLLDHPDILLISCVVFSTKLLYPFDGLPRPPLTCRDPSSLQMDWESWREIMREIVSAEGLERLAINKLQPEDAWTMSDRKIDDYLDWFQETQMKEVRSAQEIREFFPLGKFPLGKRQQQQSCKLVTEEEIDERLEKAQSHLRSVASKRGNWLLRIGDNHAVYRSVDDLPDAAKAFYAKVAELSGMSQEKLVKAVYNLETYICRWGVKEVNFARQTAKLNNISQAKSYKGTEKDCRSD